MLRDTSDLSFQAERSHNSGYLLAISRLLAYDTSEGFWVRNDTHRVLVLTALEMHPQRVKLGRGLSRVSWLSPCLTLSWPIVGVFYLVEFSFDLLLMVFSTWMAFGGNTRDLGSFREETDKILVHTERRDGVAGIKRRHRDLSSDDVKKLTTAQRDGESTKEFMRRYKLECRDVKGAPECMKISGFMHGITNPELIKRLHDKILKSVDEMMRVTTTFLRGEVAASNRERKKSFPSWKQQEANQKQNFKKGGFRNQQRSEKKQD
ncbi:hypothetical protein Tco_0699937 [Tanacetum coccineum]